MAKCTDCGSETELYSRGAPICVKCSDKHDDKRKPDDGYPGSLAVPDDMKRGG
jgi:hypothetical protein